MDDFILPIKGIFLFSILLLFASSVGAVELHRDAYLKPLEPNGCSKSPDGWWNHCCVEHDIDYYIGGSRWSRFDSDRRLKSCMKEVKAPGMVYFIAVRLFGFKSWGGGWLNRRYHKRLSSKEVEIVEDRLHEFRKTAQYKKYFYDFLYYHGHVPMY